LKVTSCVPVSGVVVVDVLLVVVVLVDDVVEVGSVLVVESVDVDDVLVVVVEGMGSSWKLYGVASI